MSINYLHFVDILPSWWGADVLKHLNLAQSERRAISVGAITAPTKVNFDIAVIKGSVPKVVPGFLRCRRGVNLIGPTNSEF